MIIKGANRMKLFTWDDGDFEIQERDPFDLFKCDAENGVEIIGWRNLDTERPVCYVEINGRLQGFTLWAKSAEEATAILNQQPEFIKRMKETE